MTKETLNRELLQQTLQVCVDEVFALMVTSFKEAAVKSMELVHPRDEKAILFREDGAETCSVDVHEQVVIGFSGDARGYVVLRCSVDGADHIARGLLMMDESEVLEVTAVRDALGECANMLAGSLKTKALDPIGNFQLGLPAFEETSHAGEIEGALVYRVAKGVMSVEVWLE